MITHESTRTAGLPLEFTSFVGRRAELASARAALGTTRLLTLSGPGGVGKTRLAIQLASSVKRLHPDGTWFVDLGSLAPGGSVADEAGRILRLRGRVRDKTEALVEYLDDKSGLLVLDNCEPVAEGAAHLAARIVEHCPRLTILVTSRHTLRIQAESEYQVAPLDTGTTHVQVSPAVRLFLERSASYLPAPDDAELAAIHAICQRLDGMPLAIELAAARTSVLNPVQILERLSRPLDLLTSGARDAPDRQQTMRATIAWSYDLCTPTEQALWRRMSVFVGGWDFEAAEWNVSELAAGEQAIDVVQSLLEKSIIRRRASGSTGYEMLDTVRLFGQEVSSAAELDDARRFHRDWYIARLATLEDDWYGPRQPYWLSYTRTELPNLRAALEYCIGSSDGASAAALLVPGWRVVWQAHGRAEEVTRWFVRVTDLELPPTPETAQAQAIHGSIQYMLGEQETALARERLAEQWGHDLDDDFTRALVETARGSQERDPELKLAHYLRASALQGGRDQKITRANIEERLAAEYDDVGNTERATQMRRELIARAIAAGESYETAELLVRAGWLAATRDDFDDATTMLRQALSLTANLENPTGVTAVEELLALVAARARDDVRAATLLGITRPDDGERGAFESSFPYDAEALSTAEQSARSGLSEQEFETAFSAGRAMSAQQGIAYALGAELRSRSGQRPGRRPADLRSVLSPRESQVAALVGQGLTDRQIAERLVISRRTAEGHVQNSLLKLGFSSRSQLAVWTSDEE